MSGGLGRLRQLSAPQPVEPTAEPEERCEFCAVAIGDRHGHVADIADHRLLCVCRPCYLLFAPDGAGGGRFRGVGEESRKVSDLRLDEVGWDALRVPVDLVFFLRQSPPEGADSEAAADLVAVYPGPAGATESELDLRAWDRISADNPVLDTALCDIEAVLLRRHDDTFSCYLVPIDLCYELVGVVRSWWKGLGGGSEVWEQLAAYFEELDRRSHLVSARGAA